LWGGWGRGSERREIGEEEGRDEKKRSPADAPPSPKTHKKPNSDQAIKGGCGQAFFKSAIAEVGEYCQISCGSCPCCRNLLEVAAEGAGGAEFAWALNATDPAFRTTVAPLLQPGFMATVLVPPNDAMASVIRRLGGRAKIATDSAARAALASIVGAHILKPNADYNAAWTSPFLKRAPGQQLPTYSSDGVSLKVTAADGVVFTPIVGGGKEGAASARMASDGSGRVDLEACKGFVIGVDQVILPYALS
jgi:hypothetical protein